MPRFASALVFSAVIAASGCQLHEPHIVDLEESKVAIHAHEEAVTEAVQNLADRGCAIHGRRAHFAFVGKVCDGSVSTTSCSAVTPSVLPPGVLNSSFAVAAGLTRQSVNCQSHSVPNCDRTFNFACVR